MVPNVLLSYLDVFSGASRSEVYLVEPRVNPYNGALKPQYRYYGRR